MKMFCTVLYMNPFTCTGSDNIALHQPAYQSSVFNIGYPKNAVDGNPDPVYYGGSCTETDFEPDPWWAVDLGREVQVDHVIIVNRADCCSKSTYPFAVLGRMCLYQMPASQRLLLSVRVFHI